jgi:hypothetical protein
MPIYYYPIDGPRGQLETIHEFLDREIVAVQRQLEWEKRRNPIHYESIHELDKKLVELKKKLVISNEGIVSFEELLELHNLEDEKIKRAYDVDSSTLMPWEDKEEDYGPYHDDDTEAGDLNNDDITFDETEIDAILNPTLVEITYDNPNKTYSVYMRHREPYFDKWRTTSWIRFNVYKKDQSDLEVKAED